MSPVMKRTKPNIMITGTPGTGKSTLSAELENITKFKWLEVSKLAKDLGCIEGFDEEYSSAVIDEDKLLDAMEPMMAPGGCIVDYHGCEFFPERWFDIVFVMRTDNTILFDRLEERGYKDKKLEDNIQCEIFGTLLEEAQTSYDEDIVHELKSNNTEDTTNNVTRILSWIEEWTKNNKSN